MNAPVPVEAPATTKAPSPHRLFGVALMTGGPLLIVAVAWVVAGTAFWQALAFWGGVVAIVNLARCLVKRGMPSIRIALYLVGVWLAWYLIGAHFALGYVHVDNFTPRGVRILLEGHDWLTLESKATTACRLRQGTYQVTIQSLAGQELDRMEITVQSQYGLLTTDTNNYVLNVLGAASYRRGVLVYSMRPEMWSAEPETQIRQKWFKVDTDYVFEDPPRFGRSGSTVTYLRRGAPMGG